MNSLTGSNGLGQDPVFEGVQLYQFVIGSEYVLFTEKPVVYKVILRTEKYVVFMDTTGKVVSGKVSTWWVAQDGSTTDGRTEIADIGYSLYAVDGIEYIGIKELSEDACEEYRTVA